jgi:hypothetical protein
MPISHTAASSTMLSLSDFARLMSERYRHFLSQSLNDLEYQIQHLLELHITNFHRSTPLLSGSGQGQQQTTRRHHYYHRAEPMTMMTTSTSGLASSPIPNVGIQRRRRSLNRTTDMGSSTNPIYVFDDDEIRCEGCWEEGHFIGNCNKEYRFDGRQYVPIPEGENPMELTYVVDRDYYRQEDPRLQAESGKSTTRRH